MKKYKELSLLNAMGIGVTIFFMILLEVVNFNSYGSDFIGGGLLIGLLGQPLVVLSGLICTIVTLRMIKREGKKKKFSGKRPYRPLILFGITLVLTFILYGVFINGSGILRLFR